MASARDLKFADDRGKDWIGLDDTFSNNFEQAYTTRTLLTCELNGLRPEIAGDGYLSLTKGSSPPQSLCSMYFTSTQVQLPMSRLMQLLSAPSFRR